MRYRYPYAYVAADARGNKSITEQQTIVADVVQRAAQVIDVARSRARHAPASE